MKLNAQTRAESHWWDRHLPSRHPCMTHSNQYSMKYDAILCASPVDIKAKKCMLSYWKVRFWVLRNGELLEAASQHDIERRHKVTRYTVLRGAKWLERPYGIQVETKEAGWLYANIAMKATWAMWIHGLLLLDLVYGPKGSVSSYDPSCPSEDDLEATPGPRVRHVAFSGQVRVRKIPALTDEEAMDLFYTKSEMEAFKGSVTTLKSFTVVMV
ncbi:hypothetical protein SDRG_14998 [Saprolegnia diclina VS20]|uniref:PH domain-containing protein n=1 Tax=Saprolegnia diclina (strain VS20) TaxID=1156394 RepID=T0PY63_SAPDV|nr:hypothetical protein SDRG_14998 [Saprolegnia diclina VS20]EQC27196.1 hypothetical protein SDRG_14998 [Saprolegnia diclina VS20]|eukprot:XP_008619383.1 hypothetical protein SDRG_14998 [Saprolegnia diclina VS20]